MIKIVYFQREKLCSGADMCEYSLISKLTASTQHKIKKHQQSEALITSVNDCSPVCVRHTESQLNSYKTMCDVSVVWLRTTRSLLYLQCPVSQPQTHCFAFSSFTLGCWDAVFSHLNASFRQVDTHSEPLSHTDVWVLRLLEGFLQSLQLGHRERCAAAALLLLVSVPGL